MSKSYNFKFNLYYEDCNFNRMSLELRTKLVDEMIEKLESVDRKNIISEILKMMNMNFKIDIDFEESENNMITGFGMSDVLTHCFGESNNDDLAIFLLGLELSDESSFENDMIQFQWIVKKIIEDETENNTPPEKIVQKIKDTIPVFGKWICVYKGDSLNE